MKNEVQNIDMVKIGNFIKERRKSLHPHMTQEKLATELNVSCKTISKWECGRGMPNNFLIPSLCRVLKIREEELFAGCSIITQSKSNTLKKLSDQDLLIINEGYAEETSIHLPDGASRYITYKITDGTLLIHRIDRDDSGRIVFEQKWITDCSERSTIENGTGMLEISYFFRNRRILLNKQIKKKAD